MNPKRNPKRNQIVQTSSLLQNLKKQGAVLHPRPRARQIPIQCAGNHPTFRSNRLTTRLSLWVRARRREWICCWAAKAVGVCFRDRTTRGLWGGEESGSACLRHHQLSLSMPPLTRTLCRYVAPHRLQVCLPHNVGCGPGVASFWM